MSHLHVSTLTQKGQATIPVDIRQELGISVGDKIQFEIIDHQVIIKKVKPFDIEYHKAIASQLSEWNSKEDEEAYRDL